MPRLTEFVLAKHKRSFGYLPDPHRYKVWNAPFIVKNSLEMKTDRLLSQRPCTDELKAMLDCYKVHDFKYKGLCDVQIQSFNNCLAQHQKMLADMNSDFKSRPNTKIINKLLQKTPQPPITVKLKH